MNDSHLYDRSHMFHSSSHARLAQGRSIGAVRPQTFGQRSDINRNRASVQGYGHSMVGQGYIHRSPSSRVGGFGRVRGGASAQRIASSPQPRQFQEPPPRYNPYR